jgi:parallel beta-helix repeat protein
MSTYKALRNQAIREGLTYKKLLSTSALVAAGLVSLHTAPALADNSWGNLNQDAGSFTTDITDPNVTNITLNTARAIGSGNADIYLGDTVNVDGRLFVVRDTRTDPSRILGNLNSNGEIIIIDDNGIFFGKDSVVDVAGLIATTGNIADSDIMDGNNKFEITGFSDGETIMREGAQLTVQDAGLAGFVAKTVINRGVITAKLGTVAFAAGEKVTLDMYGDGLFEVAVDGEVSEALLKNTDTGEIKARGGKVTMSAAVAKDVVDNIINVDGIVNVSSATVKGGKIVLAGGNGKVKVSGKLKASGATEGGDISVTGQEVVLTQDAKIVNDGDNSKSVVFGTDKAIFRGSVRAGTNADVEISGKELVLNGDVELGEGSEISFDPVIFTVGAGEAATFESALNNNGVTVNVEAEELIIVNSDIDTSAQTTSSVFNLKDQDANNDLQVNLNALITLGASQSLTGDATFVNVSNGSASIQNGIDIAATGATVELDAGTYNENIRIDKTLKLLSEDGRGLTKIEGISGVNAPGTVVVEQGVSGVQIGDTDKGIHIVGIDNGNPAAENAAVYLQGLNNNIIIKGNEIEAAGDFGLRTEYAEAYDNIQIDDNIFSGKSFVGATSATGDHSTVPNVARPLVYIGGPDKTNISFTNNTVTGDAGDSRLVSLEADTLNVTGNTFTGTTSGVDLRLRGVNVVASANNFIGNLSGVGIMADGVENLTIGGASLEDKNVVSGYINGISVVDGSGITTIQNNTTSNNTDTTTGRNASGYKTGVGIIVDNTAGTVTIADNTTTANTDGIRLVDTEGATISGNTVFVNGDKGIITKSSDDVEIIENTITGNIIGVYLDNSVNGLVQANTIDGSSQDGVHLRGATTSASIQNNFITNSGDAGVDVESAASVTIYDNSFAAADGSNANASNIKNASANTVDASFNWFGSNDDATVAASVTGAVDISPIQAAGVDTSTDAGYQGGKDALIVTTLGAQTSGLIQEAVDLADDNGTVTVNAGDYTENLFLDVIGLKLVGLSGANLNYDTTNAGRGVAGNLITVAEAGVTIDPFTFDGAGVADYGIHADGLSAEGLTVDGNTFQNFKTAGIYLAANSATTGTIVNNTFEGSSTRGIETGDLDGGYTLDITNNTIGNAAARVLKGIQVGAVRDATLNISGGSIAAGAGEGIDFTRGTYNGADVNISNITVSSTGDEAIDVQDTIRGNSTFDITGGSYTGGNNGVEFTRIQGDVNIANATIIGQSATKRGLNLRGGIKGNLIVTNANITGGDDAIGADGNQDNAVDGGLVQITDSTLNGINGNGIELGDIKNGGIANLVYNNISAGEDGIQINGDVTGGSRLQAAGNSIGYGVRGAVGDDGIEITGDVENSTVILSHYGDALRRVRAQGIRASGGGIVFGGDINDSDVQIATYINNAGQDGLRVAGNINNSTLTTGAATFDALTGGEGAFGGFQANAGQDGVEFEGQVRNGSTISIDSNLGIRGQNGDGIRFERDIASGSTVNISTNRNDFGGDAIIGSNNGISIEDVKTNATVNIDNNRGITGQGGNGIEIESITGAGTVNVTRSRINGDDNGIFVSEDISGTGSSLNLRGNTIVAGDDGLDIDGVANGATVNIGGFGRFDGNNIVAGSGSSDDGIEFDAGVDANVNIVRNRISAGGDGIFVTDQDFRATTGVDNGATINITNNNIGSLGSDRIGKDGINFDDSITDGSTVNISGNSIGRSGAYVGDDAIDVDSITDGATVNITNNDDLYASDNGVEVNGEINNATLNITGNRNIRTGDHGVFVGENVWFNSSISINNNTISASENRSGVGNGIHFDGDIYTADITIGEGNGNGFFNNPSNIITGVDGIQFAGSTNNGADIKIDGNRIGYAVSSRGRVSQDRVSDDGIQFLGDIEEQASVSITDNYILAGDDGVSFIGDIEDDARIVIGGANDGNTIDANGDGVQFADSIRDNALLTISYNDIEADANGIVFNGDTSNHIDGENNPSEILIANNSVDGGQNGILFEGLASNGRHDIVIRDNTQILGRNGDGIRHEGGVKGADIAITDNDRIAGRADGVHVEGFLYNNARIDITGNENVTARFGDGIEVTDTGFATGANVNINGNTVTRAGNNGIEVANVAGVDILRNTVTNTGDDGIDVKNSAFADIGFNQVTSAGDDGIDVEDSAFADINDNIVIGATENGIDIRDSFDADIQRNVIALVGEDGIFADNITFGDVRNNIVVGASDDGIDVRDSAGIDIVENAVLLVGDNGIQVRDSNNFNVDENIVGLAFNNGIDIDGSNDGTINDNRVGFNANDGIYFSNGSDVEVDGNTSVNNGLGGIALENATNATVTGNTVNDNAQNGIAVIGGSNITVSANTINDNGFAGINASRTSDLTISGVNTLDGNDNGIELFNVTTATIEDNTIANSLTTGISIQEGDAIDILNNDITGSGTFGLRTFGGTNGTITLAGNAFTDNPTGARFESGIIDLSDLTNPNTFTNTDPLATPVGLKFDEVGAPGSLSLAGNTIGGTVFDGFTNPGSFYVRIEDGALLDTTSGAPLLINGLNASYDGLVPSLTGGLLSQTQLDTLEARIFDADDLALNGRGQLFVGFVPGLDNLQDFFNQFGGFPPGFSGLNVLIRNAAAPAPSSALNFANIEPAAGEGEDESGEGVADIEPAAGEETQDAACWGDALSADGTVSYNFGGSFEESLADAASCGS